LFGVLTAGLASRWRTGEEIVSVEGVEAAQVEFEIDKVVQDMLEGAGQQLPFKINGEKARAGLDDSLAGHVRYPKGNTHWMIDIPFGSQQNARMNRLFYGVVLSRRQHSGSS
jgi:hypothetical protein